MSVEKHPLALLLGPWLTLYSLVNHISDYMLISSGIPLLCQWQPTHSLQIMNAIMHTHTHTHTQPWKLSKYSVYSRGRFLILQTEGGLVSATSLSLKHSRGETGESSLPSKALIYWANNQNMTVLFCFFYHFKPIFSFLSHCHSTAQNELSIRQSESFHTVALFPSGNQRRITQFKESSFSHTPGGVVFKGYSDIWGVLLFVLILKSFHRVLGCSDNPKNLISEVLLCSCLIAFFRQTLGRCFMQM